MKISERKINNIVLESIKKVVNEGAYGTEYEDKWNDLKDFFGSEKMLNELYDWLDYDVIRDFINDFYKRYDL